MWKDHKRSNIFWLSRSGNGLMVMTSRCGRDSPGSIPGCRIFVPPLIRPKCSPSIDQALFRRSPMSDCSMCDDVTSFNDLEQISQLPKWCPLVTRTDVLPVNGGVATYYKHFDVERANLVVLASTMTRLCWERIWWSDCWVRISQLHIDSITSTFLE